MTAGASKFWQAHPGLVWSNPLENDAVHIWAALVRPRFHLLLEIAVEFGLPRVRAEWDELETEVKRARPVVERILLHIEEGFARADAGN